MIPAMAATIVLVMACILVHYETLRLTTYLLPKLTMPPRPRIMVVMGMVFLAHTIEVWIFAFAYYFLESGFNLGAVAGITEGDFTQLLYFSTETYTSLGFGDVYPLGGFQLIAGVEALLGLLMIGWSASFTYLEMTKLWDAHPNRGGHSDRRSR